MAAQKGTEDMDHMDHLHWRKAVKHRRLRSLQFIYVADKVQVELSCIPAAPREERTRYTHTHTTP